MVAKAGSVIASKDVATALELERDDDEMDRLHRALFTALLDDRWTHGVEEAIDITLSGATTSGSPTTPVSVGRRVVYLVTGEQAHDYVIG